MSLIDKRTGNLIDKELSGTDGKNVKYTSQYTTLEIIEKVLVLIQNIDARVTALENV